MPTLVIGDVHGCAEELAELLQSSDGARVVLVGDLFTKGPDPVGVWELIQEYELEAVLGNQDARLIAAAERTRPSDTAAVECADKLSKTGDDWLRWLRSRSLFLEAAGFVVVHAGLHPSGDLNQTTRSMALSMRRFPMDSATAPAWHKLYTGSKGVVFGHDARRGLIRVERDGLPFLLGLDSGCVYGRQLTGVFLEEDRFVTVNAKAVYEAVS